MATTLTRSADFALDKPAGVPCPHLRADYLCGIHDRLRPQGFPGCATFDCFGAGQRVTQETFGGRTWREHPDRADQVFAVFAVMRELHELLWHLHEARDLVGPGPSYDRLTSAIESTDRLAEAAPDRLERLDPGEHRQGVLPLLRRVSEELRSGVAGSHPDHGGADLVGADLRGADLRGASLRSTLLIGADLRGARLDRADVTGADLRAADVRGTDLSAVLFLTQPQVDATRGDLGTALPDARHRPPHWPAADAANDRKPDQAPDQRPGEPGEAVDA